MNNQLINVIRAYFATQPVLKAWLFGSYARGEQTPDSDVDILVVFDEENGRKVSVKTYRHRIRFGRFVGKESGFDYRGHAITFRKGNCR